MQITEVINISENVTAVTMTVLGVSKTWASYFTAIHEQDDFINGVIELAGLACGSGGVTSLPASAAISTFKQTVFTSQARPRMSRSASMTAPAASNQADAVPSPEPNKLTADCEEGFFKQLGVSGANGAVRAGDDRTLSNEKVSLGALRTINSIRISKQQLFGNSLNLYGAYKLKRTQSLQRRPGCSINAFLVDKESYGTPFGWSIAVNFSDNWSVTADNILAYGAMAQGSVIGDVKTALLAAGVLYGLPLAQRYALNPSVVVVYDVLTINKTTTVAIERPFIVQPSLNGSVYFTRLFMLDIKAKTTLLLKDYSDIIVNLGTTVAF